MGCLGFEAIPSRIECGVGFYLGYAGHPSKDPAWTPKCPAKKSLPDTSQTRWSPEAVVCRILMFILGDSINREPQNRSQYIVILNMRAPK